MLPQSRIKLNQDHAHRNEIGRYRRGNLSGCNGCSGNGIPASRRAGATRTAIGVTGNPGVIDPVQFENLPGVAEAIRVSKPYKLVTLDLRPEKTVVAVGEAKIGGDDLAIIAGPCAVENRENTFAIAEVVRRSGAKFFRGGASKPGISPYAFQGLGDEGWKILSEVRQIYGLKSWPKLSTNKGWIWPKSMPT